MIGPVCLPTREARWALRMATYMAQHARQPAARRESVRLRNTLTEALTGEVTRTRAEERERRARYCEEERLRQREYNRLAARRRRARLRAEQQGESVA